MRAVTPLRVSYVNCQLYAIKYSSVGCIRICFYHEESNQQFILYTFSEHSVCTNDVYWSWDSPVG